MPETSSKGLEIVDKLRVVESVDGIECHQPDVCGFVVESPPDIFEELIIKELR